ncbi:MAG: hypothetical protein KDA96_15790 [Planctomycetaceae bacterium]|nr:hypothetical protein [Planctomycetaceae bacterium]
MTAQPGDDSTPSYPAVRANQGPNVVAIAGLVFAMLAVVLYGLLFLQIAGLPGQLTAPAESTADSVSRHPGDGASLEDLKADTPAILRMTLVGGAAGLLNLVALVLSAIGLWGSRRYRSAAYAGAALSLVLLFGVLAVILISAAVT